LESIETGPDGAGKKSHYTYDDYERIISRVQGEPGPGAVFESYIYDSFGRLARAYVSNYSSLKITGYIRFSYDDYDRLQKGFFTSISGEKADIFITYNNDSLPIEILWNFYSGKFRKITFEFEAVE
ncbi:MAG TPA: hypothetical protein VI583_13600, partial [Cyclobacteriaceae bacterium]|nr:hypothetical protein [Cyclobacteriaceae bacterium]